MNSKINSDFLDLREVPSQIEQSYRQLPISLIVNIVNGLVLVAVLWSVIPHSVISVWFLLLTVVNGVRYRSLMLFRKAIGTEAVQSPRWESYFMAGALASGIVWGAAGFLLFHPSSFVHEVFLAFVIGGMVAGAVASLSGIKYAFWLFAIPAVLPVAIRMSLEGDFMHLVMGGMIFFFMIAMLMSSTRVNQLFRESEALRRELMSSIERSHSLEHMVRMDVLTQIPNRLLFEEELRREWRRAERDKDPLAVICVDIDHFKEYNDHYGHPAGDKCLKKIAALMQQSLSRPGDIVARIGGEEFSFLLPKTDLDGALAVVEQVQSRVKDCHICHEASPVVDHVTLSFGIATSTDAGITSRTDLMASADEALYKAKGNGRNQVVCHNHKGRLTRVQKHRKQVS